MSMLSIKCPNCGGQVSRKENGYFGQCPYCGSEIAFDEIREEAEVGAFKDRLDALEKDKDEDQKKRQELKAWFLKRNIYFIVLFVLHFLAWLLAGYHVQKKTEDHPAFGFGMVFLIIAVGLFLSAPPLIGSSYPAYNLLYNRKEPAGKLVMWLKLVGISFALLLLSILFAFAIVMSIT